jgi:hypothetical protein
MGEELLKFLGRAFLLLHPEAPQARALSEKPAPKERQKTEKPEIATPARQR